MSISLQTDSFIMLGKQYSKLVAHKHLASSSILPAYGLVLFNNKKPAGNPTGLVLFDVEDHLFGMFF